MTIRETLVAGAVLGTLALATATAQADTIGYDFTQVAQGTTVTPTTLVGSDGITTATFSSPTDASSGGSFTFGPNSGIYGSLGANVLSSAGTAAELDVAFNQAQTGLSLNFAIGDFLAASGTDTLSVLATFVNGTTQLYTFAATPNGLYPQGSFSLATALGITNLAITASDALGAESFAISNMTTQTPLPAALPLLLSGLAGLGFTRRRREAKAA